jgi:molybdopterin adenylyltransferase
MTGPALRVVVITVSDRSAAGEREDRSGPVLVEAVEASGAEVVRRDVVPDDPHGLATLLQTLCDAPASPDLILTTGGTGVGPRDCTPEATRAACQRMVPGIAETLRARSLAVTPHAMLSRGEAGVRGTTLIVNLPGSPGGARDGWEVVAPVAAHAASQLRGGDHPAEPPAGVGAPPPAE